MYVLPSHGFLHYYRSEKLNDSDSELEDLKEFLGPETPVYDTSAHGYSALEILQIALGDTLIKSVYEEALWCTNCASFVVDLDRVPLRDLHADDNVSWATSLPRRKYVVEKEDGKVISAKMFSDSCTDDSDSVVTIYQQYGTHKGTPTFRRIIATVRK